MALTPLKFPELSFIVVDNEPDSLKVTQHMLGYVSAKKVHSCKSAKAALDILADPDEKINCVISKYIMEPITGLELLQRIRDGRNPGMVRDTRFVLITPYTEAEIVRAAIALDVDGYAVRPVSQKKLMQVLTQAFARKRIIQAGSQYASVELPKKS